MKTNQQLYLFEIIYNLFNYLLVSHMTNLSIPHITREDIYAVLSFGSKLAQFEELSNKTHFRFLHGPLYKINHLRFCRVKHHDNYFSFSKTTF